MVNGSGVVSSGVWPTAEIAPASASTPIRREDSAVLAGSAAAAGPRPVTPSRDRLMAATSGSRRVRGPGLSSVPLRTHVYPCSACNAECAESRSCIRP